MEKLTRYRKVKKKQQLEADIFVALAGFADWSESLDESEIKRCLCDPSSKEDIERWFEEVVFPVLYNHSPKNKLLVNNYLQLLSEGNYLEIQKKIDGLSPVPFTRNREVARFFFYEVGELLKLEKYKL